MKEYKCSSFWYRIQLFTSLNGSKWEKEVEKQLIIFSLYVFVYNTSNIGEIYDKLTGYHLATLCKVILLSIHDI